MRGIWTLAFAALFTGIAGEDLAHSQARPNRPSLIRDTDTAEGKDEAEADKEKPFNPMLADKSVKIGDFYFKKKNYSAAIDRYLEAIAYQPNLIRAYERLTRAYEKDGNLDRAVEVCRDFLKKYPSSPKAPQFKQRITQLEKKTG